MTGSQIEPARFPLGIQYHRPPTPPPEEWESDLAHVARLGLDHIYIWVTWPYVERSQGSYAWDELERLVDLSAQYGLDVALDLELWAVPTWAERDEFRQVGLDGQPRPFASSPIHNLYSWRPCLDNLELRKLVEPFLRAAVDKFEDKPNLLCWKVWNEPDVDNCACPDTSAKFRKWLEGRFGSLERVSAFLGRQYNAWQDIKPPVARGDTPAKLLYTEFRFWSATEIASWAVETVREADPGHPILTDTRSIGTARLDLLGERIWDDWSMAKVPDIFGGHLHTAVGAPHASPVEFAGPVIDLECKRSATRGDPRGFWVTEVPGGTAWIGDSYDHVRPGEMRYNLWSTIAHGATSVSPWQFKPERVGPEVGTFGVVEMDGASTYRTHELEDFVQAIRRNEQLFLAARPPAADYAVLYSPESSVAVSSVRPLSYTDAIHGIVAALWRESVHFDLVRTTDDLGRYKVVYLPMPWLVPSADLQNLLQFVDDGGTVCAEAGFACLEDNGWYAPKVPRMGLSGKLGYQEREVVYDTTGEIQTAYGVLRSAGEPRQVDVEGAEVIGTNSDGSPAVVQSAFGRGRFVYFSSYPSLHQRTGYDGTSAATLMRMCGLNPIARVESESPVTCRVLEHDEGRILLVFNHGDDGAEARVSPCVDYRDWTALYSSGESKTEDLSSGGLALSLEGKGVVALNLENAR